jgi:hypothetical protein
MRAKGHLRVPSLPSREEPFLRYLYPFGIFPLFAARHRLRRECRCAGPGVPGSGVWNTGTAWRTQHSAWISSQDWRLAGGSFPGPGDTHDAQLLGSERSIDGPDANGDVYEEHGHDWSCVAHLTIWSRAAELGRAEEFGPLTCEAERGN